MTYKNLVEILSDSFSPALIVPESESSPCGKIFYSSLRSAIENLASIHPFSHLSVGNPVSFLIPNSLEYVLTFFAILSKRAVCNPLNPAYTVDEIVFYLKDVAPKFVIIRKGDPCTPNVVKAAGIVGIPVYEVSLQLVTRFNKGKRKHLIRHKLPILLPKEPALPDLVTFDPVLNITPVNAQDPIVQAELSTPPTPKSKYDALDVALFLHTSGTTGRPKGVPLTHLNILTSLSNITTTYRLTEQDTCYLVMPLFHVHGLIGCLLSTFYSSGTVILPPKFSVNQFWKDVIQHNATWYSAVPTIHQMLLNKASELYPGHSGKLRFIRSSSSSLSPATLLKLETTFKAPVIEAYSMSEAAHQMTSNFIPNGVRKPGSVGPGRGVLIRILNDKGDRLPIGKIGEVCISGENVISGYHNNSKANQDSFVQDPVHSQRKWFRTGDLGYLDANKFLYIVGRMKEQINRGGEKISPVEIDAALLEHPRVLDAVSFGVPSALYGQEVEVAVVLKPETDKSVIVEELKKHLASCLAPFKIPKVFHLVETIPKTATGKVQRRLVAEHFEKKSKL